LYLFTFRKMYNILFGHFELYCPAENAGFDFPKEARNGIVPKRDIINEVRRRKKIGDIPPPYPNGWFALLRSRELEPGASISVNALGQNFAVFRDRRGTVHILDAYCPHLGANLGIGGKVCLTLLFSGYNYY